MTATIAGGGNSVEILAALQNRLPETGQLQRFVILEPETGGDLSAVLVRVPPGHEFPLHTHPVSEDCFFVLSGAGEATEPGGTRPISAPAGVWVPAGHPHGLVAGAAGMLEVGFQSPADPRAVPFENSERASPERRLLTESLPFEPGNPGWHPVFAARDHWRYLDPHYATLDSSQHLVAEARDFELVLVLVRGAVELITAQRRIDALALVRLRPGTSVELRALESPALLLGIRGCAGRRHG